MILSGHNIPAILSLTSDRLNPRAWQGRRMATARPRRLGWKGLCDAQLKEQAQLTSTETAASRRK